MAFLLSLLGFILPSLLGWQIITAIISEKDSFSFAEKLFLSYGLGFGCMTLIMLYCSFLGINFHVSGLTGLIVLIMFLVRFFMRTRPAGLIIPPQTTQQNSNFRIQTGLLPALLLLFILMNVAMVVFRTMVVEIDLWDSWAVWAFKAKIFYYHQRVPFELFSQFQMVWGNWDYPLHIPLMETWVMLWSGYWDDFTPRFIFPLFYIGVCVVCFNFLRRNTDIVPSLVGTSMVATLPTLQYYTLGTIAEPVLLFYYLGSFVFLVRWVKTPDQRFLVLSAIFSGLALWTKSEAIVLIFSNILVLTFFLIEVKKFQHLGQRCVEYMAIPALMVAPWYIFKYVGGIQNIVFNSNYFRSEWGNAYLARIIKLPGVLWYYFSNCSALNATWLVLLLAMVFLARSKISKLHRYIFISIFFQLFVYCIVFVTIPWADHIYLYDTMIRLMIPASVLALLNTSLLLR